MTCCAAVRRWDDLSRSGTFSRWPDIASRWFEPRWDYCFSVGWRASVATGHGGDSVGTLGHSQFCQEPRLSTQASLPNKYRSSRIFEASASPRIRTSVAIAGPSCLRTAIFNRLRVKAEQSCSGRCKRKDYFCRSCCASRVVPRDRPPPCWRRRTTPGRATSVARPSPERARASSSACAS
jgi:hypothetical protein